MGSDGLRDSDQKRLPPNNIATLREKRGLSQKTLADMAGTSQQEIQRLETGQRKLTWEWMLRLSTALKCHPLDLVNYP